MTIEESNAPCVAGIKQISKHKGIKQTYLAKQLGLSEQAFCDMLNGRRLIKACDIPKIAQVLGVTIDEIFYTDKRTNYNE